MTPQRISLIAAIVLVVGGAVALAHPAVRLAQPVAQAPHQPASQPASQPMADPPDKANWLAELNLSAKQVQTIRGIRRQYKDQLTAERQAARQARIELRDLMGSSASANEVRQKYQQVSQRKQAMMETQFESLLAIREVLTPDQRKTFVQRMEQSRDLLHADPDGKPQRRSKEGERLNSES